MGSIAPVAIAIGKQAEGLGTLREPLLTSLACFLVTLCVNKFTMPRQNRWMDALQTRISKFS